ncbi:MAG: GspE/PulE family protein [Candidatus Omnitrophica bacterium]|nr:GspE/PulE family protein [Candidatus Omnitrophota bacterium]
MIEKFGEFLLNKGLITAEQLDDVLKEQSLTNVRLGDIILSKGYVSNEDMAPAVAQFFDLPYIDLKAIYKNIDPYVINCIPKELAYQLKVLPIKRKENTLYIVLSDPLEVDNIDLLRISTGCKIECCIAIQSQIMTAIDYCYHSTTKMQENVKNFIDVEIGESITEKSKADEPSADDAPVVAYVKSLIIQAVNNNVSDIIIQPKDQAVDLRFRIDGILYEQQPPPKEMFSAIASRIKILGGMNIAEKRIPQDGRFRVNVSNRDVDLRVSSFPTIFGESMVLRLLNSVTLLKTLAEVGFSPEELRAYRTIIHASHGLILVTGPTGSGKTTTLYSSLEEIQTKAKHIMTMEDPVEYRLRAVTQSQVNSKMGFTFASGLRAILRQSPDVILIGEIRDQETAEIAIHAALTGHLVFATLHTNDACSAPIRLINMGVEAYLLSSCLLGVLAQRLIRVICPDCKTERVMDNSGLHFDDLKHIKKVNYGKGCSECFDSGYKGRDAIFELMIPNERIDNFILERTHNARIKEEAVRNGMITLRQNAIKKLMDGHTTVEEVLRLT